MAYFLFRDANFYNYLVAALGSTLDTELTNSEDTIPIEVANKIRSHFLNDVNSQTLQECTHGYLIDTHLRFFLHTLGIKANWNLLSETDKQKFALNVLQNPLNLSFYSLADKSITNSDETDFYFESFVRYFSPFAIRVVERFLRVTWTHEIGSKREENILTLERAFTVTLAKCWLILFCTDDTTSLILPTIELGKGKFD